MGMRVSGRRLARAEAGAEPFLYMGLTGGPAAVPRQRRLGDAVGDRSRGRNWRPMLWKALD